MVEYTWDDIIINPNSEKAQSCIGKKCYYADNPTACIDFANSNDEDMVRILQCIQSENTNFPFCFGTSIEYNHACIILKKEEEPEYIPFDNIKEFVKASLIHNKDHYLSGTGIWVEESYDANREEIYISMVSSFFTYDNTIFIDGKWLKLEELLDSYTFLDDTPCGKLKESK